MANVGQSTNDPADRNPVRDKNRGQLILVSALGLAVLFVTLALILNTAIYTENLASRSGDHGGATDAVRYQAAASDAIGDLLDYVNTNNHTSHSTLQSNLTDGVAAFRNHSSRLFSGSDRAVETNLESTTNGTRIEQTDGTRNFTDTNGDGNWTLATKVNHSREFRVNVTRSALNTLSGLPFTILVNDGSSSWQMNLTKDGSDIVVSTKETTCSVTGDSAWINVTAGTVSGTDCENFSFASGVTDPYDITYENASNAEGTYHVIVDNQTVANSPGPHLVGDGSGQPFAAHAIYSTNVSVDYETTRLFYNATFRIAPGESHG